MNTPLYLRPVALTLAAAGWLTACGSGSSGGDSTSTPTPVAPAPGITLAGVVAKGAALANASVAVTCATGNGTSTTAANGSYTVTIATGTLPCVLKATSSDGATRLHSVAPASASGSVTANVTPLTELVVAQLTGKDPATYVAGVSPGTLAGTATAGAVAAAQTALASTLSAGGVSTSAAGDFISGNLVAASGNTAGNAYDQVLDALNAKLVSSGSTLAALTATVAANSPAATGGNTTPTETATLPADLLLKPKAANCASLASGSYRLIKFAQSNGNTVTAVETLNFDAPTLTFSTPGNTADNFTVTPNGNCRFSVGTDVDMVVSPAGVVVVRSFIGLDDDTVAVAARGTTRMMIGLPVQAVALSDLAGTWSTIGWERTAATVFDATAMGFTVASSGALTQAKCGGSSISTPESGCSTFTTLLPVFSNNVSGGFNITSTDPQDVYTDRAFAYRAGNGELMLVALGSAGEFTFAVKTRTLTLPDVGARTTNWNVDVRVTNLAIDPLYSRTHTVVSVNTAAGTLLRSTSADASTVTVPETLEYNKSRNGYVHRLPGNTTASDGSAAVVRELWGLSMRGFGITPYYLPTTSGTGANANARFGVSVTRQP